MTVLQDGRIICKTNSEYVKIFEGEKYIILEHSGINRPFIHIQLLSDKGIIGFSKKSFYISSNDLHTLNTSVTLTVYPLKYILEITISATYAIKEWDLQSNLLFEREGSPWTIPFLSDQFLMGF